MLVAENNHRVIFACFCLFNTNKKCFHQTLKYVCIFEQQISLNAKCLKLNILNIIVPNNLFVFYLGTTLMWCQYKQAHISELALDKKTH